MKVIRSGITRTVILVGRYAIKVPSLRGGSLGGPRGRMWSLCSGVLANLSEREWSGSPGVCPVLWSLLGVVNVYPRCEPAWDGESIDYAAIGMLGPGDEKPENVGWLNGRMVWVDYDMSGRWCDGCREKTV